MKKLKPITEEEWLEVCEFNRDMVDNFLLDSVNLSPKSLKAYRSSLMIFFIFVKDSLGNKRVVDIKPREYLRFQNYLIGLKRSSSDINSKRSAVSSLANYIVNFYDEEFPTFRNFITRSIPRPADVAIHKKEPLSADEMKHLIEALVDREDWQKVAYLKFTYDTGARREEVRNLRRDTVNLERIVKVKEDGRQAIYYLTDEIRAKGRGKIGNMRRFAFSEDTMSYLKKWVDTRTDDSEWMFVTKTGEEYAQISEGGFNYWCNADFSEIVGRRVHPHLFRTSRATQLSQEDGHDIEKISKLLGHASTETTQIYIVRDDSDDLDELFM